MLRRIFYKYVIFLLICFFPTVIVFTSCEQPNPLYGTWANREGDVQMIFVKDSSCMIKIPEVGGGTSVSGTYRIIQNIIVFEIPMAKINTEFTLNGNALSIAWTYEDGNTRHYTLYKTKN